MKTCVVTGGAGFLGSHLCENLLAAGHRVICLDNLETGSLENIAHIRDVDVLGDVGVAELEFLVADVRDVLQRAGLEVVEAEHAMSLPEQVLAEVGAEETGAAGDYAGRHRADANGLPRTTRSGSHSPEDVS